MGKSLYQTSLYLNIQRIYQAKIYSALLLLAVINNNISISELQYLNSRSCKSPVVCAGFSLLFLEVEGTVMAAQWIFPVST